MTTASLPRVRVRAPRPWRLPAWATGPSFLAVVVLAAIVLVALVGPLAGLPDPGEQSLLDRLKPPVSVSSSGTLHLAGTDQLGRDVLSRSVHGARVSLAIATVVVLIGGVFGSLIGLLAGYRGGALDSALMRLADFQMAFPPLLLAIFLLYVAGASLVNLAIFLTVLTWIGFARLARGQALALRSLPYVEAAVAVGCRDRRIIVRHLLPQVLPVLVVAAVFDFASMLLAEASLSFLGLGVQPPDSSWGLMLSQGQAFVTTGAWWLVAAPGVAMFVTTLSIRGASRWLQARLRLPTEG
jgi:peptide/nickel transport system permease protein